MQGLEWVAKNHESPAIVHMSVEGGFSAVVNKAVDQLIKLHQVAVVVSSGECYNKMCRTFCLLSQHASQLQSVCEKYTLGKCLAKCDSLACSQAAHVLEIMPHSSVYTIQLGSPQDHCICGAHHWQLLSSLVAGASLPLPRLIVV